MIASNQQIGDLILGAFVARRALLIGLAAGLRLVGSRLSPDTRRLREFLARNRIPHGFLDVETDQQAEAVLRELGVAPSETPLLLGGSIALRNPTTGEVVEALNLRPARASTRLADAEARPSGTDDQDGSNPVNRTANPAFDFAPDWQPLGDDRHCRRR